MPDVGFGGSASGGSWSAGTLYSDGIGLPVGRVMANGSQACLITALFGYVGGRSAARTISLSLGSSATGAFGVAASGTNPPGTGWVGSSGWLVQGGSARFSAHGPSSGGLYFGKAGGGTVVGPAQTWAGTLGGAYRYAQAPSQMAAPTLTAGPGELTVDFSGPADDGGSSLSVFIVQYGTDPTFATTTTAYTGSGHNVYTVTPGLVYYARVSSSNAVTAAAGTVAQWSGSSSVRVGIGGKRWDGTAELPFTTAVRWDGTTEVPITTAMRWDGTAEVPISG